MITSARNRRVAEAIRLKRRAGREAERRFLVEGVQAVGEAIASGAPLVEVFRVPHPAERVEQVVAAARARSVPVHEVSPAVMERLASTVTPQGIVAVAGFVDVPLAALAAGDALVAVLAEVRDPGNAGTIIRTADAIGAGGVVLTASSVDPYNPKTVRATAGSLFHLPVVRGCTLEEAAASLRGAGFRLLAAAADGEVDIERADLSGPIALVFGNEAWGLPAAAAGLVDATVRIPMRGRAESLNLAAAAAVLLFEAARRQTGAEGTGTAPGFAALVREGAHDLRTPATTIRGFASLLRSRWAALDDARRLEMVGAIEADAERVAALLARLHEAARLADGSLRVTLAPVDATAAIRAAAESGAGGDVDVVVEGLEAGARLPVGADVPRLEAMLSSLVEAARWWGREGPVRIEILPGERVTIRVVREGGDLDDRAAAGLLAGAAEERTGNRLALFVAAGLAAAMGARLSAAAERGGPAFMLQLAPPPPRRDGAGSGGGG